MKRSRRGEGMRPTVRNRTALFVDTIVAHMGEARVTFGDGDAQNTMEQYLTAVLAAEDSEQLDFDTETACAVDGDAIWKVTWDVERDRPRIAQVAPEAIWIQTRPDDRRAVELVAQRYKLTADDFPVMFGDRVQLSPGGRQWITEEWTAASWRLWLDDDLQLAEPNPYPFIPYIHFPNWRNPHEFWGRGDGERIRALQDRINYAEGDLDDTAALAAYVIAYFGVDDHGNLAIRPGALQFLPPDARVEIIDFLKSGALTQRLEYVRQLIQEAHDEARVPKSALGGETTRALSGFALQTELGPLVRLVNRKRLSRSAALRTRARMIAQLGAKFGGMPELPADTVPKVTWSEAIPADRADELANAEAEARLGRDLAEVLRSIGVEDPDAELARRRQQNTEGLPGGTNVRGTERTADRAAATG